MAPAVGTLSPQNIPPIRVAETLAPAAVWSRSSACPSVMLGGVVSEVDDVVWGGGAPPTLTLTCLPDSGVIQGILFAAYGTPEVSPGCTEFKRSQTCDAVAATDIVTALCVNKTSCTIVVSNAAFGGDPCPDV